MKLVYLIVSIFIAIIIWFIPDTVHFRDSGEFHLVAHYLDIAHPAGFPTYGVLSNLISLIPFGPIVWRTHLFSVLVIGSWLLTLIWIAKRLRDLFFPGASPILSILVTLPLVSSFPLWKSAFTAEVYGLHAFLLTLCFALFLEYYLKKDLHFVLLLSVVGALALGNHAASFLILIPCAVIWSAKKIPFNTVLTVCWITIIFTLGLYLYLSVRGDADVPLGTGYPVNFSRFMSVVTNARDSALRPVMDSASTQNYLSSFFSDLSRIADEMPRYASMLGIFGFVILSFISIRLALTLFLFISGTLFFFSGWDSDPWLLAFGGISILSFIPVAYITHNLKGAGKIIFSSILFVALTSLSYANFPRKSIEGLINDRSGNNAGRVLINKISPNSVLVVESSWFVLRALTLLEGFRDDLTIINTPGLLFPRYFTPVSITSDVGSFNALDIRKESDFDPRAPAYKNLGRFINTACKNSPCVFEPNIILSVMLKEIALLTSNGLVTIESGKGKEVSKTYADALKVELTNLKNTGCPECGSVTYDRWNYAEVLANNWATLLIQVGASDKALEILETLCNEPEKLRCSHVSVKNLISLASQKDRACEEVFFLKQLTLVQPSVKGTIEKLVAFCTSKSNIK